MTDHDGPWCAELGHFVWTISAGYCPHHQAWTAVVSVGDDQDDIRWRGDTLRFGPFDSEAEIVARLQSEVARCVRTDLRGWLADRT